VARFEIIVAALLLLAVASDVQSGKKDKMLDQKRELEQLQHDVDEGRRRLDSLQEAGNVVQKKIGEYDQKISSDRKVIRRLGKELDQLQMNIAEADSQLTTHRELLDRNRRRFLGSIRSFYIAADEPDHLLAEQPNTEAESRRKVLYLSALADYELANVDEASQLLSRSGDELDQLSGRHNEVRGLKKNRETSYALETSRKEKSEKSLDQLRRKSRIEADRVIMLQKAAEEMAAILARLEEERIQTGSRGTASAGPSFFAGLKGTLPSPYRGKITQSFGEHVDDVTKLKSFSPGIDIEGRASRSVYAVASGTVAYAGELRGYGNFVIINHDHQYYTTYAGLGKVSVREGQYLRTRDVLGNSGDSGVIRFELRKGREPLDPVKWLNFESI